MKKKMEKRKEKEIKNHISFSVFHLQFLVKEESIVKSAENKQ